jgi:hypothetical protein
MGKSWDEGRVRGRWDHDVIAPEEEKRIQSGIDDTMKSVIADQLKGRAYDPWRGSEGGATVKPVGAPVVKDLPGGPTVSEPFEWKPMHPVHDFIRLGSTVPQANIESAENPLRTGGVPLLPGHEDSALMGPEEEEK